MSERLTVQQAADMLRAAKDVLILTHKNPDGDTLGSGFSMWAALRECGVRSRVANAGEIPARYSYMTDPYRAFAVPDFEPQFVLAVDTAAVKLLGEPFEAYGPQTDLCIDHHGTNEAYARNLLCDPASASCCELVAAVVDAMGVGFTTYLASCLYTGVSTDTGCFRYANTTADSHLLAARLIGLGVDHATLNRLLFETKSRGRAELEQLAVAGMQFSQDGRIALIAISREMLRKTGCDPSDVEGITPIPRTIEGVEIGITMRELQNGHWKVSLRTFTIDASAVCARFGGGGHKRASGFETPLPFEQARDAVMKASQEALDAQAAAV